MHVINLFKPVICNNIINIDGGVGNININFENYISNISNAEDILLFNSL